MSNSARDENMVKYFNSYSGYNILSHDSTSEDHYHNSMK